MEFLPARRTVIVALVTAVVGTAVTLGACNETRRSLGEECLKGDDCLSTICSSQHCAEAPPVLEASVVTDASSTDAVTDAAPAVDAQDSAASTDAEGADASDGAIDGD
jgi:hypothetical protein